MYRKSSSCTTLGYVVSGIKAGFESELLWRAHKIQQLDHGTTQSVASKLALDQSYLDLKSSYKRR